MIELIIIVGAVLLWAVVGYLVWKKYRKDRFMEYMGGIQCYDNCMRVCPSGYENCREQCKSKCGSHDRKQGSLNRAQALSCVSDMKCPRTFTLDEHGRKVYQLVDSNCADRCVDLSELGRSGDQATPTLLRKKYRVAQSYRSNK